MTMKHDDPTPAPFRPDLLLAGIALAAVIAAASLGCRKPSTPGAPPAIPPRQAGGAHSVPTPPTTAGSIAVNNLVGEIDTLERQVRAAPGDGERRAALVTRLLLRAQVLGRLGDYDRALALADEGVRRRPLDGGAYLSRARVRQRLHLFSDALGDIDAAVRAGLASDPALALVRADILAATGRDEEAEATYLRARAVFPQIAGVGAEAAAAGRRGDTRRSEALFALARINYRDVSPFPLAWLELQQGLLCERRGDPQRARGYFQSAQARLPGFAPAEGHLAGLEAARGPEGRRLAVARLVELTESSDDPEYLGQLAGLYAEDGLHAEAERVRRQGEARYEQLLARHRAAFVESAARFWLGPGRDPKRALALAREGANLRPTADTRALYLQARAAARAPALLPAAAHVPR